MSTRHEIPSMHMMSRACQYKNQGTVDVFTNYDLCLVSEEDDDNFYGRWVTGFGFFGIAFPKQYVRHLTEEEIGHYDGMPLRINSMPIAPIQIRRQEAQDGK